MNYGKGMTVTNALDGLAEIHTNTLQKGDRWSYCLRAIKYASNSAVSVADIVVQCRVGVNTSCTTGKIGPCCAYSAWQAGAKAKTGRGWRACDTEAHVDALTDTIGATHITCGELVEVIARRPSKLECA